MAPLALLFSLVTFLFSSVVGSLLSPFDLCNTLNIEKDDTIATHVLSRARHWW
jgi:hypothetical protein